MRNFCSTIFVGLVLFVQTAVAIAGQLPSSLEQYRERIESILAGERNETVKEYLRSCLAAADHLNGLEAADARIPAAFSALVRMRLDADGKLDRQTSDSPGVRAETEAYNAHLQPYLKEEYISLIRLQDQLLERKYFKNETAKNANFLEGLVNSYWSLTRADHSDIRKVLAEPRLGVSPWEAIFRLEPALAIHDGARVAILGTAGLCYAFFPELVREEGTVAFRESFWSKWVQKTGGRIGVGVGEIEGDARLLLGTGMQLNAVGLWGLYEPDGGSFMFGVSASDLSKFKKAVSWF
ncbi:MAG: hypothetical protein FD174_4082 [Geobacteraceae bacterium]|nr:MAG: hypothetical protein FD174_4082 [Geobacteraceae bacterium]